MKDLVDFVVGGILTATILVVVGVREKTMRFRRSERHRSEEQRTA